MLDHTQLGFRPQFDDRVFLYNAARTVLLDAAVVRAIVRARSGTEFLTPTAASFGADNNFAFQTGVVAGSLGRGATMSLFLFPVLLAGAYLFLRNVRSRSID